MKMRIIECVCSCSGVVLLRSTSNNHLHICKYSLLFHHSLSFPHVKEHTHTRTYSSIQMTHHTHRYKRIARIKHKIHLFKIINISWERKEQENETRCRIKGVNLCLYIEIKPKYVCAEHSYLIAFFIQTRTPAHTGSFLSCSNILFFFFFFFSLLFEAIALTEMCYSITVREISNEDMAYRMIYDQSVALAKRFHSSMSMLFAFCVRHSPTFHSISQ